MTIAKALQIIRIAIDKQYGFCPDADNCFILTCAGVKTNETWIEIAVTPKYTDGLNVKIRALIAQEDCIFKSEEFYRITGHISYGDRGCYSLEQNIYLRKEGNT